MRRPPFGVSWTAEGPSAGLIYWNPCGRAVDMARRPYTTLVRPFRNSDITVRIRWYPARPEDGTLGITSKICSLDWSTRPEEVEGVAEVYGASRNYNRAKAIPGERRTHVCGDRFSHMFGGTLEPGRPEMKYLPSGLPICCEPGRREGEIKTKVEPQSRVVGNPVYRSAPALVVVPVSRTVRSPVYRSSVCVCVKPTATLVLRSDPYRSSVCVCVEPESAVLDDGRRESEICACVQPESVVTNEDIEVCPVLADECADAVLGELNWGCTYGFDGWVIAPGEEPPGHTHPNTGWRKWPVQVGHHYRFELRWLTYEMGGSGTWRLLQGSGCSDLEPIATGYGAELPVEVTFTATDTVVALEMIALAPPTPALVLCRLEETE